MNLLELIAELKRRDIELFINDEDKFTSSAPVGAVTDDLVLCIKRHKQAIRDMLLQQPPKKAPQVSK